MALKYSFFSATFIGILAFLFAGGIIRLFTSDPLVTSYTRSYMWTVVLSYGFLAAIMVEASAFQAKGKSWPGFWIFFIKFIVISIPLSYVLTNLFHLPITSIWVAIAAGNIVASMIGYFWAVKTMDKTTINDVPVHVAKI